MRSQSFLLLLLALLAGAPPVAHAAPSQPHYALVDTVPLPGPVKWDFLVLDAPNHHLFLTRDDRVDVLDTNSKKIIASIDGLDGAHGVALAPEINKGFISEGKANRVTVFDLTSLKPTLTIPTGKKPDTIIYEQQTGRIFVADADSNSFTIIDAKTSQPSGLISLDGAPEFAVLDGAGRLYVNIEDKAQIAVVNLKAHDATKYYELGPVCEGPTGLALDKASNTLFSVCANKHLMVVDASTGKIKDTLDIGGRADAAVFDADTGLVFSSNGEGTLTVVAKGDDGHYKVVQTVPTKLTARTMALDPATHDIYLSAAETEGFDPATKEHPEPRPHVKPDTFMVIRVSQATAPQR